MHMYNKIFISYSLTNMFFGSTKNLLNERQTASPALILILKITIQTLMAFIMGWDVDFSICQSYNLWQCRDSLWPNNLKTIQILQELSNQGLLCFQVC